LMKIIHELEKKVKQLKKEITAIYYAYQHPKMTLLPKCIILFTLGYALSPIDLIPDFIPVLGYLDDLIILPALLLLAIRLIPADIMAESRKKAEILPLQLKKNRVAAALFICLWTALFIWVGLWIVRSSRF